MGKIAEALKSFPARFRGKKGRALTEAAAYLQGQWKLTCSVSGTKLHPARPGSPPHAVTGRMMAALSVVANLGSMLIEMKYGSKVAGYQDHGTSRMAARPHRSITLDRCRPRLNQILGK